VGGRGRRKAEVFRYAGFSELEGGVGWPCQKVRQRAKCREWREKDVHEKRARKEEVRNLGGWDQERNYLMKEWAPRSTRELSGKDAMGPSRRGVACESSVGGGEGGSLSTKRRDVQHR